HPALPRGSRYPSEGPAFHPSGSGCPIEDPYRICHYIPTISTVTCQSTVLIPLTEIADRVHEQMWTTAETMRRRAVAAGDSVLKLGDKVRVAGDRLRDVSEPAYLDLKDYVSSAVEDTKPFEELVEDDRHTLIEMYLGTSVRTRDTVDGIWYGVTMDDTERRTSIFMLSFLMGILGSFTFGGPRLLALAPSLLFLTPTVLALTIDNQIICVPKGFDRHKILMGAATLSLVLSTVFAYFPFGHLHKTTLLYFAAHAAFLFVHAQRRNRGVSPPVWNLG
ncbi:hypothetical protein PRIPAC_88571, partial [Pristionchus pacificus]|uniref:Uncharacterized protein n=1 Tax=Pristionchus pacificus TaxID=54126 RepID=A0A2A6CWE5_PRIPA